MCGLHTLNTVRYYCMSHKAGLLVVAAVSTIVAFALAKLVKVYRAEASQGRVPTPSPVAATENTSGPSGMITHRSVSAPPNTELGSVTTAPPVDEVGSQTIEEEEEQFKWLRATTDRDGLQREFDELSATLTAIAMPAAIQRIGDGEYEVINALPNGSVALDSRRKHLVEVMSNDSEGRPIRVVLPEAKYPDAYALKRKMGWLEDLMADQY